MSFIALQRQSTINCVCSKTESFSGGENPPPATSQYTFTFNSPCCCPDGCSCIRSSTPVITTENPQNNKDLSLGSVLLIIFFSLVFVYFIGGPEMIPNYGFWSSVPRNIKAGVSFTVSKARGSAYQNF
ncbi:cation-dependent mannose-6-phosphate receptor-like [Brachionus plicatilis]|uniref:Cation-dependent mannose-6-phosphate receptor-like n=1 Tax=Brachionus plicatilis TaxID=10195 RepID=A0A3M7Q0N8_BRAPC|nr:cation-dependent mannose-6-phosphate receptor-like [Brachionus plicatilis]